MTLFQCFQKLYPAKLWFMKCSDQFQESEEKINKQNCTYYALSDQLRNFLHVIVTILKNQLRKSIFFIQEKSKLKCFCGHSEESSKKSFLILRIPATCFFDEWFLVTKITKKITWKTSAWKKVMQVKYISKRD